MKRYQAAERRVKRLAVREAGKPARTCRAKYCRRSIHPAYDMGDWCEDCFAVAHIYNLRYKR